jgi:hypothetical protein
MRGNAVINGKLIVGNNTSFPDLQLGSANGYNIGVATGAGSFSSSAQAGDMVIRSIETKRLILQANGGGSAGIIIDSSNNVSCTGTLTLSNSVITNSINNSLMSYFHPTPYNKPANLVSTGCRHQYPQCVLSACV